MTSRPHIKAIFCSSEAQIGVYTTKHRKLEGAGQGG